jgi:hypothetical protein
MITDPSAPMERARTHDDVPPNPFWPREVGKLVLVVCWTSDRDDMRVVYGISPGAGDPATAKARLVFQAELHKDQCDELRIALAVGCSAVQTAKLGAHTVVNVQADPAPAAATGPIETVVVIPSSGPGDTGPKAQAIKLAEDLHKARLASVSP